MNARVTVVIPCYNQGRFVLEAIDSVLASTFEDLEILVVNDGSTEPRTNEILGSLARPRTRTIQQGNGGLPGARNRGFREAAGKYVLPLDADDRIEPTLIEKAFWVLELRPDLGFVSFWLRHFGDETWVWKPPAYNLLQLLSRNTVTQTSLVRKAAWEQAGGYDEEMRGGYEDWDFWLRLGERGWYGHQIPEALFSYRRQGRSMLDEARARHEELVERIQANHVRLYSNEGVAELRRTWGPGLDTLSSPRALSVRRRLRGLAHWLRPVWLRERLLGLYLRHRPRLASLARRVLPPPARLAPVTVAAARFHDVRYDVRIPEGPRNRLLYVMPWMEVGGADKMNLDLLGRLPSKEYAITIVTTLPSGHPWEDRFREVTSDIFHLPNLVSGAELFAGFLGRLVESRRIDLVQISNSLDGYRALPAISARFPGLPIVSLVHMYEPQQLWCYARVSAGCDRSIALHVAVARWVQASMISALGLAPDRVDVIENGVDEAEFRPAPRRRAEVRERLRIPDRRRVVAFIGRLTDQKDPAAFLRIADRLARDRDDLHFLIVGGGPLESRVESAAAKSSLRGRVTLLGVQQDIAGLMSCSDVLLAPSRIEGLPIVGLEAMASGLPIVATRVRGWDELVTSGHDGLLVPPDADAEAARAVVEILDMPGLAERISGNARRTIEERFTIRRCVQQYEELYRRLLERSRSVDLAGPKA